MHKHGLLDQLPIFRMKIDNQVPFLGELAYSPIHFYIKKEGDQIVEISQIKTPLSQDKVDAWLEAVETKGNMPGFRDKIKLDFRDQLFKFNAYMDLGFNQDFDYDSAPDYVSREVRIAA